ncbi:MAG: DUF1326 domain-containing protein [Actinobacteria bacterium]|nr:DUF1326 domain-containing protein [Actinomycetota bacterium]
MTTSWNLSGTYFESCNCDTACPCVFLSEPTEDECTVLVGWHIEEGSADEVGLDGLNVALAVRSPGHMAKVPWTVALYLDERADGQQSDALTRIFTGQAGGHPARLASHIGEVLGISSVAIDFTADGRRRALRIGDVGSAEIEAIEGQGGGDVTVTGHPLCIAPGDPVVVARSTQLAYHDHGLDWELSEKNGFFSPFAYGG